MKMNDCILETALLMAGQCLMMLTQRLPILNPLLVERISSQE